MHRSARDDIPLGDLVDRCLDDLQARIALEVGHVVDKVGESTKRRIAEIHTLAQKSVSEHVSEARDLRELGCEKERLEQRLAQLERSLVELATPGEELPVAPPCLVADLSYESSVAHTVVLASGEVVKVDSKRSATDSALASVNENAAMEFNPLEEEVQTQKAFGPALPSPNDCIFSSRNRLMVNLWPVWRETDSVEQTRTTFLSVEVVDGELGSGLFRHKGERTNGIPESERTLVSPSAMRRVLWYTLSTFFLGYDILVIPLQAFDIPPTLFTDVMAWVTTVFWTVDIFCTFMVGYHDGGIIEVRPNRVACHYLKTWFTLDLATVSVDWFFIIGTSGVGSDSTAGLVRIMKSMRFARVMRVFRLLRIVKVLSLVDEFSDFIHSEGLLAVLKILKLTVGIAILNHFVACGWYALGNMDMQNSWVDSMMKVYPDASIGFLYTTSLHWSLTQFTPASMEVVPRNVWERLYTACIIILALVMFSSFVSSITQAMTRLQDMNRERWRQQENVRRFIVDNHLSLELSNRIYSYLRKHRTMTRSVLHENDVPVFGAMPETLRVRLHCEVFTPILKVHPFFFHFYEADHQGVANVCHSAMAQESLLMGQELFIHGERSEKMFFVVSGEMDYLLGTGQAVPLSVREGAHVAEMALWLQWHNRGLMSTTMPCEVVSVDSAVFRGIVCQTVVFEQSQQYARDFAQTFVATANGDFSRLSDLWGDFDDLQEIAQQAFDRSGGVTRHQRLKKFATQQSKLGSKLSLSTELSGFQRIVRRFAPQ